MSKLLDSHLPSDMSQDTSSSHSAPATALSRQASTSSLASTASYQSTSSHSSDSDSDQTDADSIEASTPPTSVSSTSSLSQPNFTAGKNAWLSAYLRVSEQASPILSREIALPTVGTVKATATVDNLPGSTLRVSVGHVPEHGSARLVMLQPGESLATYAREARSLILDRIAAAPKEHYAVSTDEPLEARIVLDSPGPASRPSSGATKKTTSLAAAGVGVALSVFDGGVTALSEALSGRAVRFSHWTRGAGSPAQAGGIAMSQDLQGAASAEAVLAAASLTGQPARGWLNGGIECGSKVVLRSLFNYGLSFVESPDSVLLPRLLDAVEPIMLSIYERAVHSGSKAKPRLTTSGERSSDLFARLYRTANMVQAVEHGQLDLKSMLPPLSWQGRDAHKTLLRLAPSAEPLMFAAHLADVDETLRAQLGTGGVLSQPYTAATPLGWSLSGRGLAAAQGLSSDRALLSSTDPAHRAEGQLSAEAHLRDGATASSKTTFALEESFATLSQHLGWTPAFARQFAAEWLHTLTGISAPSDPRVAQALQAVGLAELAQAPHEAMASLMAAIQSISLDSLRVHAPSADRLLNATPTVGADAALAALVAGIPNLGHKLPQLWQAIASDSNMHIELGLRRLDLPVDETPLAGMKMGRYLNLQVHRPGTFVIDHRPTADAVPAATPGTAARMAAWVGSVAMAPVRALQAIAAALAHALMWPVRVFRQTPVQRVADHGAQIRITPTIRTPKWTHQLFGKDLSLSWLLHVRLHGAGPALYERDGRIVADPARGAAPIAPGATADANGKVFGRGEVRLFSLPVYRFNAMPLGKLPLGRAAVPRATRSPGAARPAPSATNLEKSLGFYGQLFDNVKVDVHRGNGADGHLWTEEDGTVWTRGERSMSLWATWPSFPLLAPRRSTSAWPSAHFDINIGDLRMTRASAAMPGQSAHVQGRGGMSGGVEWNPRTGGLYSGSAHAYGELEFFGSSAIEVEDNVPRDIWSGHVTLNGDARGAQLSTASQWPLGDLRHGALMDDVGLSKATAWMLPNKVKASAHFDLQQLVDQVAA